MDVAALRWDTVVELHDKHHPNTNTKNFPGDSLVYVTPWNSQGYDVTKTFAGKFTHVSPVWLQLRADENGRAVVAGLHDIDQGWMRAVRSVCGTDEGVCPRIVPRLMWEATSLSAEEHKRSIELIAQVVDEHGFDGIVLERPLTRPVFRWAELLATRLHALRTPPPLDPALRFHTTKHFVVVAPPTLRGRDGSVVRGLAPADFVTVMKFADRLSLMTYDFSSSRGVVGPNAPLEWVRESASTLLSTVTDPNERKVLAAKVLVGLAMYGHDNGEAVLGSTYIALLQAHRPTLRLDEKAAEHFFDYKGRSGEAHRVFYPTQFSVRARLDAAKELGMGVSVWEIGQGLPAWYDLF